MYVSIQVLKYLASLQQHPFWSIVVRHMLTDFADIELVVDVVAPCDEARYQASVKKKKSLSEDSMFCTGDYSLTLP